MHGGAGSTFAGLNRLCIAGEGKSRSADDDQPSHFDDENLAIRAFINGRVPRWLGGAPGMRRLLWFAI